MQYPERLIPKISWKTDIEIANLLKRGQDFFVCRRLDGLCKNDFLDMGDGDYEITMDKRDRLFKEIQKHFIKWSLNIMGALFQADDAKYRVSGLGNTDWNGGWVNKCKIAGQYKVVQDTYVLLFFLASDINDFCFPYPRNVQKVSEIDIIRNNVKAVSRMDHEKIKLEGKKITLEATNMLRHNPLTLNYWHVMLEQYPADSKYALGQQNSAWQKHIVHYTIENCIMHYKRLEINNPIVISPSVYKLHGKVLCKAYYDIVVKLLKKLFS